MLKLIFSNPKRLFVCIFLLFLYGVYSGLNLPISMYPATSKPTVNMWIPYGTYSADSFQKDFGSRIESMLKQISNQELKITNIFAYYEKKNAYYEIEFDWNTPFDVAKKEVEQVSASISSMLPKEISDRIGVWQRNRNSGFFAASLYSSEMSLRELFDAVDPILTPELDSVVDAERALVWNPEQYSINIRLLPEKMTSYGLFPRHIKEAVNLALKSYSGSTVQFGANQHLVEISANVQNVEELNLIPIQNNKMTIYLKDVADIDFGRDLHRERLMKTNGVNSLILFAKPKAGANVKKMSEDIMAIVEAKLKSLPESMQYKIIVDPSRTIKSSIISLMKDVILASFMAVLVLFMFIGGIKNIGTAVIEIPLSMVLSFICMNHFGMNLNLISLGGLALAAGMNVDASIVIMENIFKHRSIWLKQNKQCDTFSQRVELVYNAVKEVALPVILSICTTLIVFIPMAFTSDLTNAILGDLARAVIFSHAISGFVALLVVPSVRVLVLKNYNTNTKAPLENSLSWLELKYEQVLCKALRIKWNKVLFIIFPLIGMMGAIYFIVPELPKKVIGKPSSDWVYMYVNDYNTKSGRHMENILQEVEDRALTLLKDKVNYTWMEKHNANGGQIMFKLFRKKDMKSSEDLLRESFKNTATRKFNVSSWNPAQLPLPKENHFKALVKGDRDSIRIATSKLRAFLKEKDLYDRIRTDPNTRESFYYIFKPNIERLNIINSSGASVFLSDIAEISKLASSPISLGKLNYKNKPTDMKMSFNDKRFTDPDALNAYPIKIQDKIIPLNSIGHFETEQRFSEQLYLNQQSLVSLTAVIDGESKNWEALFFNAKNVVEKGLKEIVKNTNAKIEIEYPQIELKNSLNQLRDSLLISLALIFFILWMQFQSVKQVGVIMMTIPLGIVGVLISLYVFGSYLSLNSALGIILLNGITVNNSILLTDVTNTLRLKGLRGEDLIISAAKKRLRPILITSLTTILGMLPVALGIGDGGKILQPLGIAVCCGLFIATGLTLFIVPTLLYRKENDLVETQTHSVETPLEFETENRPIL